MNSKCKGSEVRVSILKTQPRRKPVQMKRRVRGKANMEYGQQGQRTVGRPEASRMSYQERWLAAPLSPIRLPSREILFIYTKEGRATHIYHYYRGKLEQHLCLDIGKSHRNDTFLGLGGLYQVLNVLQRHPSLPRTSLRTLTQKQIQGPALSLTRSLDIIFKQLNQEDSCGSR